MEQTLGNDVETIERGYRAACFYIRLKEEQRIATQGDFLRYLETLPEHQQADVKSMVQQGKAFLGRGNDPNKIRKERLSQLFWTEPAVVWATFVNLDQLPMPGHPVLLNFIAEVRQYIQ